MARRVKAIEIRHRFLCCRVSVINPTSNPKRSFLHPDSPHSKVVYEIYQSPSIVDSVERSRSSAHAIDSSLSLFVWFTFSQHPPSYGDTGDAASRCSLTFNQSAGRRGTVRFQPRPSITQVHHFPPQILGPSGPFELERGRADNLY